VRHPHTVEVSMLPFLAPKKQASVIIAKRVGEKTEPVKEEGEHEPGLMAAAEDLISAIHAKDAQGVASALKAAAEVCESYEQDMGPFGDES
jgi:hypothetical protein